MPKKTTILILILAAVTGALLFFAVTSTKPKPAEKPTVMPVKKAVVKSAKVFFNPQNIDISNNISTNAAAAQTVDLMIDSGGAEISGVQVELQYDPKAIMNVRLLPAEDAGNFFGGGSVTLFNEAVKDTGRISYVIAIGTGDDPKKGIGKIATLYFQKASSAPSATTIRFLDKTLVTILDANESVLKETMPLNIILGQSAPAAQSIPQTTSTPTVPAL